MNIIINNNSGKNKGFKAKIKPSSQFSNPNMSAFNKHNERPLQTNQQDLSFKGLFYNPVYIEKTTKIRKFNSKELMAIAEHHLGDTAKTLFSDLKGKVDKDEAAKKLINIADDGTITFHKKTALKLVLDGILYPFITLPISILDGIVTKLGKIKPLKDWSTRMHNSNLLKNSRQRAKLESKVNSLRGLFETLEKHKGKNDDAISSELFQASAKMFDQKTGNYDTKHERSLCRIVSGFFPAIFLATDAYNLSMMYNGNKKDAEKEQKARFKQEVIRVVANAYLTLVTFGAIQKHINNSKPAIMLNTALTVLFTESIARIASGKSITRLTPEQAKTLNAKNGQNTTNTNSSSNKTTIDKKNTKDKTKEPLLSFSTLLKASAVVIGAGFGIKGLRKVKTIDGLFKGVVEPFKNLYKNLTINSDFTIEKGEFEKIVNVLKANKFDERAEKYENVAISANKLYALQLLKKEMPKQFTAILEGFRKDVFAKHTKQLDTNFFKNLPSNINEWSQNLIDDYIKVLVQNTSDDFIKYMREVGTKGSDMLSGNLIDLSPVMAKRYDEIYASVLKDEIIHIGEKEKGTKPFVDFFIAPFKFISGVVKFPYTITEKVINLSKKKEFKVPESLEELDIKALLKTTDKMLKAAGVNTKKKLSPDEFKTFINDNMAKAFNSDNVSNVANNELANLAKTSATAATIWFLMTDNYNMAMLKSNGEDVEGAKEKFKARFVQECSRLFYQTLLIDLFNNTFKTQYNNSLWGMTWITSTNTLISEILNRKSIGMPVLPHSKNELEAIEVKKENATGFLKGYYNFMARLTGKKTLAERQGELKKHN